MAFTDADQCWSIVVAAGGYVYTPEFTATVQQRLLEYATLPGADRP